MFKFDLKIFNPSLIIPISSKSEDAIVVNFEKIIMNNVFSKDERTGIPTEHIQISVTDLDMFHAKTWLEKEGERKVEHQADVVENFDFKVYAVRPNRLETHQLPAFRGSVEITSINVIITEDQLRIFLGIYSSNLHEVAHHIQTDKSEESKQQLSFVSKNRKEERKKREKEEKKEKREEQLNNPKSQEAFINEKGEVETRDIAPPDHPWVKFQFDLVLERIEVNLLKKAK